MPTKTEEFRIVEFNGMVNYSGDNPEPPLAWSPSRFNKTNWVTKGEGVQGWRQRIARGENCTTNLSGYKYMMRNIPGRAYLRQKRKQGANPYLWPLYSINDRVGMYIPIDYPMYSVPSSLVTAASNMAKQRVMSEIIDQQQAFQGLVFAGEGRETLRMIRGAGQQVDDKLKEHLSDVKKRSRTLPRALDRKLDALANLWLTVQYGVKPLLNDIDQGARALADDYSIRPMHKLVTGVGEARGQGVCVQESIAHGAITVYHQRREWAEVVVILRAMVGLNRSEIRNLTMHNLGFNLRSFVPSVYELIPYSFLLDYFTNVNEIVNAWSYGRSGVWWTAQTIVQRNYREQIANGYSFSLNPANYNLDDYEFRPCSSTSSVTNVDRSTYVGSLVPSLEFELPTSATRVANIGALAWLHKSALRAVFGRG